MRLPAFVPFSARRACTPAPPVYISRVHGLLKPILIRIYASIAVFSGVYFLMYCLTHSTWNKERIYQRLISGNSQEQQTAAIDLVYYGAQGQLVHALRSNSRGTRELVTNSLWELWSRAAGNRAYRLIQASQAAIERKDFLQALDTLNRVVKTYPRFAEGWNRRATLFWLLGQYDLAVADSATVLSLNPDHFGAWQGMGLCQFHLGKFSEACRSIRAALRINPHDESARNFLKQCEEINRRHAPQRNFRGNLV